MRLGKVRHESKYLAVQYFYTEKNWSIGWMCRQLEISRSAYYKWLHREVPDEELENIRLAELIKEYDERFCHILGYRRMTSWINHFNHTQYSKNRVHRIMKKLGIHSVIRQKKKKNNTAKKPKFIKYTVDSNVYSFKNLDNILKLCEISKKEKLFFGKNSMYKYNTTYFLVFNKSSIKNPKFLKTYVFLSEFCENYYSYELFETVIKERAKLIIENNAFQKLNKI